MFKNQQLKKRFLRHGYCSFKLLSKSEIDALKSIYNHYQVQHNQSKEKFRGTGWIENEDIKDNINRLVAPLVDSALASHFSNHQILGYNFLIKDSGVDSAVPMHQDWTYVDERIFFSMNVWVALEDINKENGSMFFIPFSHKIFSDYLRPSPSYPIPFSKIKTTLSLFRSPVFLRAGECVCFDNRTIHGSYPNMSDTNRLVLVSTIFPANAELLHHYIHDSYNPKKVTEYYLSNADFFKIRRGEPPPHYIKKKNVETSYNEFSTCKFVFHWVKNLLYTRF